MIGVGIVGLSATGGWAAGAHLPALRAAGGVELRALVASTPASARAASEAYGVPADESVEQLARRVDVDLVLVAVKVPQHRELVLPAIEAGVPVLSEWPLAVDLREAEELERAAQGPQLPLEHTGQTVTITAEDQIAISGTLASGAILSAHYRGGMAPGFSLVVDGTEGRLEVTAPTHPNLAPITVRAARGQGPAEELPLPAGYDTFPELTGARIHALTHAYAAIRDDLTLGTTVTPDFAHAVKRDRLLDAITRSAVTGRRATV